MRASKGRRRPPAPLRTPRATGLRNRPLRRRTPPIASTGRSASRGKIRSCCMYAPSPWSTGGLPACVRSERAFAAANDVALLMVAVLGFSMFFGSLTEAYLRREAANRARVLEEMASSLLAAVIDDPRWTVERAVFVAWNLANATSSNFWFAANGHPFQ